jgi:DNA replication protein DnaC
MADQGTRDIIQDIIANLGVKSSPAEDVVIPESAPGCEPWCHGEGVKTGGGVLPYNPEHRYTLLDRFRSYTFEYCSCAAGKLAREKNEETRRRFEEDERTARTSALLDASGLPSRLRRYTLDSYLALPGAQPSLVEDLRQWYDEGRPRGAWLMLRGDPGIGKTGLAAALLNMEIASGRSAVYVDEPDFLARLRATYRGNGDEVRADEHDVMESFAGAGLLLLDDLGATDTYGDIFPASPWVREKLFTLIKKRDDRELPTIITTNLEPDDLEIYLGQRTFDRIRGLITSPQWSYSIRISGNSRRGMS